MTISSARRARRPRLLSDPVSAANPLYKHVKNQIIRGLTEGEWKPGEMLPNERRLAERFGVGISTIRAAIGELVSAAVLVRRQGKGTLVAIHGEQRSVYQFFHVVRNDGRLELPVSELLSFRKAEADDEAADILELPRGRHGVYRLRNVLRVGGTPVVVSDIVIPQALFPGLTESMLKTGGRTLYAIYQQHFGINIVRTTEQLRSLGADPVAAKIFNMASGDHVLEMRRVAYTFNALPVEIRRSQVDTRQHYYRIEQDEGV